MALKTRAVPDEVLSILSTAEVDGNIVRLTCGQLDRKQYEAVNGVLTHLGGKWKTRVGHIFASDPRPKLEAMLLTGEYVDLDLNGYFPTPQPLVVRLMDLAGLEPGMSVLEPSAGRGAIAVPVACVVGKGNVWCCELLPENAEALAREGFPVMVGDFLGYEPRHLGLAVDRVVMNPPFANKQDIDHVRHALTFLKPGGRLVSVMSAGVLNNLDRKSRDFRQLLKERGNWEANPEGSFKPSGTDVRTITVVIES
jgi:predicted RNA methylase